MRLSCYWQWISSQHCQSCFISLKVRESGAFPILTNTKKSHLASSIIHTKWSNPIGCCALAKNCDWFRKITPLSNLTRVPLFVEWKLTANDKNWTAKSTILKENAGKVKSVFVIGSARWAEKLGCCPEYCRSWKLRSQNLRLRSTWRPFYSSFERKGALGSASSIFEPLFICWPLHCYVTRVNCIFIRICMGTITIVSVTYENAAI